MNRKSFLLHATQEIGHWTAILVAVVLLNGCATARAPLAGTNTFRVMTYNIHHGEGLDGRVDLPRIAEVIRRESADIVALQEVDKGVTRTDRRDLTAELAALTGLTGVFRNNFHYQGGEYGNAILTRFPVVAVTNLHYTMLRTNEQRGLLQVTLNARGRPLVVLNTHIDYRGDDSERLLNVEQIFAAAAGHAGRPILLCGDFNDTPGSRTHTRLKERFADAWELAGQGDGHSYPADQPRKRIDYIWLSPDARFKPVRAWIPSTDASDHRPVVVELVW